MLKICVTIPDDLLHSVDSVTAKLGTTRSAFIRSPLEQSLLRYRMKQAEEKHRQG